MWRLFRYCTLLFVLIRPGISAADDRWKEDFKHIVENVSAQLSKSANYACTESLERVYINTSKPELACGGPAAAKSGKSQLRMHDRLRLDIAVSNNSEIYSWTGQNNFSSDSVTDVVRSGPISSGNFVGFLRNIFFAPKISIFYRGESHDETGKTLTFSYSVPAASSYYHVATNAGDAVIPFHGGFSANAESLQLSKLTVIGDNLPEESNMCAVETEITYQMVSMSGTNSLIPAGFVLSIGNESASLFTQSTARYSRCREFRGESTLLFELNENSSSEPTAASTIEEMPARVRLNIAVTTRIDDTTSFTGDPVEGLLLNRIKLRQDGEIIPKGARVYGMITELISHAEPENYYSVRIEFERLTAGNKTYLFRAAHLGAVADFQRLASGPRGLQPQRSFGQTETGAFLFPGSHLRLHHQFQGEWETVKRQPAAKR